MGGRVFGVWGEAEITGSNLSQRFEYFACCLLTQVAIASQVMMLELASKAQCMTAAFVLDLLLDKQVRGCRAQPRDWSLGEWECGL